MKSLPLETVSKRQKQKVKLNKIYKISRTVTAVVFVVLGFIAVSHFAKALNIIDVRAKGGIPASWGATSAARPDTISLTMTYFDQMYDCTGAGTGTRQFEFSSCKDSGGTGLQQGLVKNILGADGLPVPAFETPTDAKNAGILYQDRGVAGHDPVVPGDNFYRWFHEVNGKSYRYDQEITFDRVGDENKYTYGGSGIFPLDNVATATQKLNGSGASAGKHNFHFTAHLAVPVRINMTGNERFDFSGDDDVWVFLNGHLVLDLGGTHGAIPGYFRINADGSVYSVANEKVETTVDAGLHEGDVVMLDFFYAERNTTQSNTLITISGMEWPIIADSNLTTSIVDNKLVQYTSSITNRDPLAEIDVAKIAAYLSDDMNNVAGFVPLDSSSLEYSYTPNDLSSWQPVEISAPASSSDGFTLATPIPLAKAGETGSSVYFRYYVAPDENNIKYTSTLAYYTINEAGDVGIAYDSVVTMADDLKVTPNIYNVNFDSAGGSEIPSVTIEEGEAASRPDDPLRDGYVFAGWTLNGMSFDFERPIDSDITLVATWVEVAEVPETPDEPTYYTIAFDSAGGSHIEAEVIIENGVIAKPVDPVRSGYRFSGWTLDDEEYDFSTPVISDLTLVATWEQVIYTINFDTNGGSEIAAQTVYSGSSALRPADPVRAGYIFLGWTLEGETDSYNFSEPVSYDRTLVAHWQIYIEEPETPAGPGVLPGTTDAPTSPTSPDGGSNLDITDDTILGSDILNSDDTLMDLLPDNYLPVFGEVVFVPNTGIMTEISATLFGSRTFASIILSQWFILVVLGIFAISFATMFALREYSDRGKYSPLLRAKKTK